MIIFLDSNNFLIRAPYAPHSQPQFAAPPYPRLVPRAGSSFSNLQRDTVHPLPDMVPGMPLPIAPFALQPADVLTLQGWLHMSLLKQSLAQRSRILLFLNEGVTPVAICGQLLIITTNGKPWKVMEYPDSIGASEGSPSRWIRIELSANTIHGHPISEREFRRLTK